MDAPPVGCGASIATDLKLDGLARFVGGPPNGERVSKSCAMAQEELDFCMICNCTAGLQRKEPAIRIGKVLQTSWLREFGGTKKSCRMRKHRVGPLRPEPTARIVVVADRSVAI